MRDAGTARDGALPSAVQILEIGLLGEVDVRCGGTALELPASKKTRALLAYLAATGAAARREALCELLWEGPDDPRAALRWSLAKLRALLNADGVERLCADRLHVCLEVPQTRIDTREVEQLVSGGVDEATTDALKLALRNWRGEFTSGLDLPNCYRFHEWCTAERERWHSLRTDVLTALIHRLRDEPAAALVYARQLVQANPYAEAGHAAIVRLQGELGRRREALAHYETAQRLLERDLRRSYFAELEQARLSLNRHPDRPGPEPAPAAAIAANEPEERAPPLIGRDAELRRLQRLVADADRGAAESLLLLLGEAGIGKSRLLAELSTLTEARGGLRLAARAHEPEGIRPYGIWVDALREVPSGAISEAARAELAPLLTYGQAQAPTPGEGTRWFDTIVQLLRDWASRGPVLVAIDDLQWADDGSCALLHYALRALAGRSRVAFAAAARAGEISDNASALRLLRALQGERRVAELRLQRLDAEATSALARAVSRVADAARIFDLSEGNPLLVLQFARAAGEDEAAATLDALVAARVARLGEHGRDLLAWAAVCGRRVAVDLLGTITGSSVHQTVASLAELEARGLLRPAGADGYDFDHELVRQAVYRGLSAPRRRLMHGRIAQVLAESPQAGGLPAEELSHHAALAGDDLLAARGCAAAGARCLQLLAYGEAHALAERGLRHLERVAAGAARTSLFIALERIDIQSAIGPALRPLPDVGLQLAQAIADAKRFGLASEAATGHYLLSLLHERSGDSAQARQSTLDAEAASRAADDAARLRQLANTAHCLASLEVDIPRCRGLLDETDGLGSSIGATTAELELTRGLLDRWDGALESARSWLAEAVAQARGDENHWHELRALTAQGVVDYERGHFAAARACCAELVAAAAKLGDASAPFADCLAALCDQADGAPGADALLSSTLHALRTADDKASLAYVLNNAALAAFDDGEPSRAEAFAREAETAAWATRRRTDVAIARALLAACESRRDPAAAQSRWEEVLRSAADRDLIATRGRVAIDRLARGGDLQTLAQTEDLQAATRIRQPGD